MNDDWFAGPADFLLTATDPSGVTLSYEIVHSFTASPTVSATDEKGVSLLPNVTAEGESFVRYRAVDGAGNSTGDRFLHLYIDLTAPTITHVEPIELVDGEPSYPLGAVVPFSAVCSDAYGSRCADDGGEDLPENLPTDAVGTHEYRIHAVDLVGHETIVTLRYTVFRPAIEEPAGPAPEAGGGAPVAVETDGAPTLAETGAEQEWPFAVAALLLVAVGALLVRHASRRSRATAGSDASPLIERN